MQMFGNFFGKTLLDRCTFSDSAGNFVQYFHTFIEHLTVAVELTNTSTSEHHPTVSLLFSPITVIAIHNVITVFTYIVINTFCVPLYLPALK